MQLIRFVARFAHSRAVAIAVFAFATSSLLCSTLQAALVQGDYLYLRDPEPGQAAAVVQVDRVTGFRTIVSQFGVRGSGVDFEFAAAGIDVSTDGQIYVGGGSGGNSVFRINAATGDRTLISGPTRGAGPTFAGPGELLVGPGGDIFVARTDSIFSINPFTGDRTLVSGPSRGTGNVWGAVTGLTVFSSNALLAFDGGGTPDDVMYQVQIATGNRSPRSGGPFGGGPAFSGGGFDLEFMKNGDTAVVDHTNRVMRVLLTGGRTTLSGPGFGNGPDLGELEWISLDSQDMLVATNPTTIFRINQFSGGDRTILSGTSFGGGIPTGHIRSTVEYIGVPEPSSLALAVIGGVLALAYRRLRLK